MEKLWKSRSLHLSQNNFEKKSTGLQDAEEVDEVLFLFFREPDLETAIEILYQFNQIAGGTVREVGRAGGESAELLHHDGARIRAFSGDERTTGVLS